MHNELLVFILMGTEDEPLLAHLAKRQQENILLRLDQPLMLTCFNKEFAQIFNSRWWAFFFLSHIQGRVDYEEINIELLTQYRDNKTSAKKVEAWLKGEIRQLGTPPNYERMPNNRKMLYWLMKRFLDASDNFEKLLQKEAEFGSRIAQDILREMRIE